MTCELPLQCLLCLSQLVVAAESRKWAIAYVVVLFYVLPGIFALIAHYL